MKNKEDSRSSTRETGYVLSEAPATTAFKVSIADFLEIVNETYRSILSADVLKHFVAERPADGYYSDRVLFSDRDSDGHQLSREQREFFNDSTGIVILRFSNRSIILKLQSNIKVEMHEPTLKNVGVNEPMQ